MLNAITHRSVPGLVVSVVIGVALWQVVKSQIDGAFLVLIILALASCCVPATWKWILLAGWAVVFSLMTSESLDLWRREGTVLGMMAAPYGFAAGLLMIASRISFGKNVKS